MRSSPQLTRARVIRSGRLPWVDVDGEPWLVTCSDSLAERPVCGDWVAVERLSPRARASDLPSVGLTGCARGLVRALEPRSTAVVRKAVGGHRPQVLAANVDALWIVCGLDGTRGLRSLYRYLALCSCDGIAVSIVLNKVDVCADLDQALARAQAAAPAREVLSASATGGEGLSTLAAKLPPGSVTALLGPSGAGKSSLVNALISGQRQRTAEVRAQDRRGRHTTTEGRLVATAAGAWLMDTPGLRELGLWRQEGLDETFSDLTALAAGCRFRDCQHDSEPGCRVREALAMGTLLPERFLHYLELAAEQRSATRPRGRKRRYPRPERSPR